MNPNSATHKQELLNHITRDWSAINLMLEDLSDEQWTDIRNADGWSVKDHVAHLTAWEQSMIALLTGTPRHIGLGVPEQLYLSDNLNAINHAIFQNHHDATLDDVRSNFESTHLALVQHIENLSDDALHKPYAYYLPDEPGEGEGPLAIVLIYNNTARHFRQHQNWIMDMLDITSS